MPAARKIPFTAAELRAMRDRGDSVAQIAARAWYVDRSMTKDRVRTILFDQVAA